MDKTKKNSKNKHSRSLFLVLFLFVSLISFFLAFNPFKVIGANSNNTSIAIDIHSADEANYSQNLNHAIVPGVQLDIIREILLDHGQPITDIDVRLATLTAILSSPIPSATPNPLQPIPSILVSPTNSELFSTTLTTNVEKLTATTTPTTSNSQIPTSTSTIVTSPTSTITATKLPAATNTPTEIFASKTPTIQPSKTSTLQPTKTRTVSATNTTAAPTNTPAILSTNTPTAKPTNSPTNLPTNTPTITSTFQPTNSPTSQSTSTPVSQFTNTPTIQNTNTQTAQPTNTPTIQLTNTPTNQPTSTSTIPPTFTPSPSPTNTPTSEPSCSLPFPFSVNNSPPPNGFINAMSPAHNEINVSLELTSISVYYNQPMELGTLGHGVQRVSNYQLRNLTDPLNPVPMNITFVDYDPATYIAKIYFETTPENGWVPQSTFEFISKSTIYNICGDEQGVVVEINFSTGTPANIGSKESSTMFLKAPTIGIFQSLFLSK